MCSRKSFLSIPPKEISIKNTREMTIINIFRVLKKEKT